MTSKKFDAVKELNPIQQTALFMQYQCAYEHEFPNPVFDNTISRQIVEAIEFPWEDKIGLPAYVKEHNKDFEVNGRPFRDIIIACRIAGFDAQVKDFLSANPDGFIVEFGASLDTRYHRITENGALFPNSTWLVSDLPSSIDMRKRVFDECIGGENFANLNVLAIDVTDVKTWLDIVKTLRKSNTQPILFVLCGVLHYLLPEQVADIFNSMVSEFPGSELLQDPMCDVGNRKAHAWFVERLDDESVKPGAKELILKRLDGFAGFIKWKPNLTGHGDGKIHDPVVEIVGADKVKSSSFEPCMRFYAKTILDRYGIEFFKKWASKFTNFPLMRDYLVGADPSNLTFKAWAETGEPVELSETFDLYYYQRITFN